MPGHRLRLHLSQAMLAVGAIALLLAALRIAIGFYPHVRQCWELAASQERLSQAYRREAARYRACVVTMPCSASEYCYNACLGHLARQPAASVEDRARVAEEHRRAAEDHERAAVQHAVMARLYRRAAFHWSQPLPPAKPGFGAGTVFDRYRCDTF
jgi:hypothetical protein